MSAPKKTRSDKDEGNRGGLSHEEIARRLNLSRTRVRQIEARAMAKMRKIVLAREPGQEWWGES